MLEDGSKPTIKSAKPTCCPLDNFWRIQDVVIHLYILTVAGVEGLEEGYAISSKIGSVSATTKKPLTAGPMLRVYEHLMLPAVLPGASTLTMKIEKKGQEFGYIEMDLEERWMLLQRRELTAVTEKTIMEKTMSDGGCIDMEDDNREKLMPRRNKPHAIMPIENRTVMYLDPDSEMELEVGQMRFWIDMVKAGEDYVAFDFEGGPFTSGARKDECEFEIRMTVIDVKDISIFKDSGERNDLTVKAYAVVQTVEGETSITQLSTDCHKYANDIAEFNWNWKLRVKVPTMSCFLQLNLVDADMLGDDQIYDPVTLPLEQYLLVQNKKRMEGQKFLPKHVRQVMFDSWPKGTKVYKGMFCWLCGRRRVDPTPAVLSMEIEVCPVDKTSHEVEGPPFEEGRAPELEPKNRFTLMQGLTNPGKCCRVMLGPTRLMYCKFGCAVLLLLVAAFIAIIVLFYGVQIEQALR